MARCDSDAAGSLNVPAPARRLSSLGEVHKTVKFKPPRTPRTQRSGIRFKHDSAASAEKYLVETIGSGCAFLDYDQDGFLDVLR